MNAPFLPQSSPLLAVVGATEHIDFQTGESFYSLTLRSLVREHPVFVQVDIDTARMVQQLVTELLSAAESLVPSTASVPSSPLQTPSTSHPPTSPPSTPTSQASSLASPEPSWLALNEMDDPHHDPHHDHDRPLDTENTVVLSLPVSRQHTPAPVEPAPRQAADTRRAQDALPVRLSKPKRKPGLDSI